MQKEENFFWPLPSCRSCPKSDVFTKTEKRTQPREKKELCNQSEGIQLRRGGIPEGKGDGVVRLEKRRTVLKPGWKSRELPQRRSTPGVKEKKAF